MLLSAMIKVLVVSGLLLGYYWLFLRNRRQHQFNRFFSAGRWRGRCVGRLRENRLGD